MDSSETYTSTAPALSQAEADHAKSKLAQRTAGQHPKLSDMGVSLDDSAHMSQQGLNYTSPTQQSEAESSTSSPRSRAGSFDSDAGNPRRPGGLSDGPNARSKSVTVAEGDDTFGALNCHPAASPPNIATHRMQSIPEGHSDEPGSATLKGSFRVGVSEDRNKRCRRTMEDAHSFVYDYAGVRGQGYFAVFDGHAGKHAAEWCGQNFHEYLLDALITQPSESVPDLLNRTFHTVDSRLSHLAQTGRTQSGCTAVTAFLRVEKLIDNEPRGFVNPGLKARGLLQGKGEAELEAQTSALMGSSDQTVGAAGGVAGGGGVSRGSISSITSSDGGNGSSSPSAPNRRGSGKRLRDFVRGLTGSDKDKKDEGDDPMDGGAQMPVPIVVAPDGGEVRQGVVAKAADGARVDAIEPTAQEGLRRVLYTANVGDARAVLCRGGKAVRLTYDHKGSDSQEAKRITDAGGFVMNNRVNGVLAVTRSLGDASMKEFVVGSPYTTETTLDDTDEFLIVACDGLWDVCEDQQAVDLIRSTNDPQDASKKLLDHAMTHYSTDNLSVMVVRFYQGSAPASRSESASA